MSARPFYRTIYHRTDWTLADAFRPQPGWGEWVFTAPVAALGEHTEQQLIACCHETAPEGYRLTRVELFPEDGPERVIWHTSPDPRFAAKAA